MNNKLKAAIGFALVGLLVAKKGLAQGVVVDAQGNSLSNPGVADAMNPSHIPGKTAADRAERQQNARIIEETLRANGFDDDRVVKAAIVNAIRESGLSNFAAGDGGHSIGLFQLNDHGGLGIGMSVAERNDPVVNTMTMIKAAKTGYGQKFRAVVADPSASAADVADAWTRYLERPQKPDVEGAKSRALVAKLWPGGDGSLGL